MEPIKIYHLKWDQLKSYENIIWSEQNEGERNNVMILLQSHYNGPQVNINPYLICTLMTRPGLMRHLGQAGVCMQRVYLCLMPQYLLSAITIVY